MPGNSNNTKRNNRIRNIVSSSNTPLKDLMKLGLSREQSKRIIKKYNNSL